jgi:DNA repair protein RadD
MSQMLRDYQRSALEGVRTELRRGHKRVVLVAPTGSGKTTIASEMIRSAEAKGNSVLFVAHRRELIEQAVARLAEHGIDAGVIMAGHKPKDRATQVASIQTLVRRENPPASVVVVDECHHARAKTYAETLDAYPDAAVIGLTATPWRSDGLGLAELFRAVVVAATPKQLIASGHLCDYAGKRYIAPDLTGVRTVAGDYEERGLAIACSAAQVVGDIVGKYCEHAMGKRAVLFASSIDNSKHLVALLKERGIKAEHLDHTMGSERAGIVARVRSGETTLISNVGILTEGVDIPELQVAILARPTKSLALYLQMVGRVMRPKADGSKAWLHDHGGNIERHGLPDALRDYSLESDTKKAAQPGLKTCEQCMAIFDGPWPCPQCGFEPVREVSEPLPPGPPINGIEVDIKLVDLRQWPQTKSAMEAYKRELVETAIRKRLKPGWVVHRFLDRYPHAPKPWGAYREVKDAQAND